MNIDNFYGNRELLEQLRKNAVQEQMPHAIILEGPQGSGKYTIARYIALLLACESSPNVCCNCPACRKIINSNSPDVIIIEPTDGRVRIGVDSVRFMRSDVYIRPNDNDFKVYIVKNADKMTPEAQNAFLKVLEEPPEYGIFILLCENTDALLVTVKSRAVTYHLERFSPEALYDCAVNLSDDARMLSQNNPDALKLAALTANGAVGNVLKAVADGFAEKCLEDYEACVKFITMLKKRSSAYELLRHLSSQGLTREKFESFCTMSQAAFSDMISYKLTDVRPSPFFLHEEELDSIAMSLTTAFIIEAAEIFEKYRASLDSNVNILTAINSLAAELASLRNRL